MSFELSDKNHVWIDQLYEKLCVKLKAECERVGSKIPYISVNGKYHDNDSPEGIRWWTNGYWPGILWQMYYATRDPEYRNAAEQVEDRMDTVLLDADGFEKFSHDIGCMWLPSAVANFLVTGNMRSRSRGLYAASILASRYNPDARFIRAWNREQPEMIIDGMINMNILYWASEQTGDPRFRLIAEHHIETCMKNSIRRDGSSNHITIMDPITGEALENPGGQGYESGSSWSRGQAWALNGFANCYMHTGKEEYLDVAKKTAHYFIANLAINDWLPLTDFRAPASPVIYDSTASAIAICGLLVIAEYVGEYQKPLYLNAALKALKAMDSAFCNWNPDIDGILMKGTVRYHGTSDELEVPIIYGDYYLTEAILRLQGKHLTIW